MKYKIIFLLLSILLMLGMTSCNLGKADHDTLAIIQQQPDSESTNTFTNLHLGNIFDFSLELPHADTTWVNIWVEGYQQGTAMPSTSLGSISYGNSPNKIDKGHMGFGMIHLANDKKAIFLYAPPTYTQPKIVDFTNIEDGPSVWAYAVGEDPVHLRAGEEILLAAYRQIQGTTMESFNPTKEKLKNMMENDDLLLLLKMKVDMKEGAS
ncbi:hypothetical protein BVG16_23480 [Paenibacillus selenitireducens]|uniref:Uncharacterized protein n=1 Tax=Paenibacillus selenitireducens TaxID=1324314 RepID=A0A1T2X492_9BACL|nr:hypothetical protein [Paenibacillus selenitireducens]OPA74718.1 hypothetical protein BVG16_23480 [Paenibacillus selenitireducens]